MGPLARATVEAMAAQQLADLELGRGGLPYFDTMLELRKRVRARAGRADRRAGRERRADHVDHRGLQHRPRRAAPRPRRRDRHHRHGALRAARRARRLGARPSGSPRSGRSPPSGRWRRSSPRSTPRTRLIALSHVSWQTGNLLPSRSSRTRRACRCSSTARRLPARSRSRPRRYDYYTVSGQKWLCGPDATGGAVRPRPGGAAASRCPTYFSQDGHDEAARSRPSRGLPGSTAAGSHAVAGGARGRPRHGSALGGSPRERDLRALLGARSPTASRS